MRNGTPQGPHGGSTATPRATEPTTGLDPSDFAAPLQVVLDSSQLQRALMRIAHEIVERNGDLDRLYLVGIPNGGVPLARRLARNLREIADVEPIVGILDTTLYRDDLVSSGRRPKLRRTEMPSAVDDQVVILVDDVCSTGRTIRAAMDALMDFGRPRVVQVVALIDRGHRELPIKIDYVGKNIPTQRGDLVKLRTEGGPQGEPMDVVLLQPGARSGEGETAR